MDIEKLIEQLRDKGCEDCPHRDTCRDNDTAECVIRLNAATALSTLQDENEKLRAEADGMRSNWYKAVEEVKKLRAELDEKEKYYDQMIDALSATDSTELERVKRERDAAIEYLREIEWCAGCKHFEGLDGGARMGKEEDHDKHPSDPV